MNDVALSMIGLAKKAGKIEIGEEPVGGAARSHKARLILVAIDASDNTWRRAEHFSTGKIDCVRVPFTKEQLGAVLGRSSCAIAAITDARLSASIMEKLAAAHPGQYQSVLEHQRSAARRVDLRQQERKTQLTNKKTHKRLK